MAKTDSDPPKEIKRLKAALKKKEEDALEQRFFNLEEELREVRAMAEAEHDCGKDNDFQLIKDALESGSQQFAAINSKMESMSRTKFWSYLGLIVTVVVIGFGATYTYAQNNTKWEHTSERVEANTNFNKTIDQSVRGLTVSFRLMEKSNKDTQKKIDELSPDNLDARMEKAAERGARRARRP